MKELQRTTVFRAYGKNKKELGKAAFLKYNDGPALGDESMGYVKQLVK